jgi:ribosomal protein L29
MDMENLVSRVSELTDQELVTYLQEVERTYIHLMIEATLRGKETEPEKSAVGVVQRLRSV